MAGYTRNDTANNIADGNVISAAPLDGEFNAIQTAFGLSGGHTHDGSTTGDGGPVSKLGPSQELTQTASALTPKTDSTIDLGASGLEFRDLYIDRIAYIDQLQVAVSDGSADGVGSHLEPTATATHNLGSATYAFNSAFVTALNVRKSDAPVVTLTNLSTDMTATEIVGSIIWESLDTQQSGVDLAQIDAVVVDSLDDSGDDAVKLTFKTGNAEALTLAMTLQSDDIIAADDVALRSDSSVLSFGADDDVTLTHVADTALRLNAAIALQFRDSALSIASSTDGQLDIDADTEIEIVAPTVDIDASTTVTVNTSTLAITGATDITGDLDVDNININGNAITSTDTNGNITITPNGDGKIVLDGLSFPIADGSATHVLKTDGSGQLSFTAVSSIQSTDVVNDTSPQLGGNLDLNNSDITGTGNINISGNATLSGNLTVNGTTTTVNTTNTVESDSIIELANGTSGSPSNDAGIIIERGSANNAFIGFDESADKFTVGTGTFTGASTGDLSISTGTLVANIEGNITGNVTGNVTGDVTASVVKATNATAGTTSIQIGASDDWTVEVGNFTINSASKTDALVFKYNGTAKFAIDTDGNFTAVGDVTASGTIS